MDSCSELPPCSGVNASNCMLMSSSWCGIGLAVSTCSFGMFNVELLLVALGCWGCASLMWMFYIFLS